MEPNEQTRNAETSQSTAVSQLAQAGDPDSARKAMTDMAVKILTGQGAAPEEETITEPGNHPPEQPEDSVAANEPADEEPAGEPEPEQEGESQRREWPRSAQRRVDKLTARAKSLEEKLAQAEADLAELRTSPATPDQPVGAVPSSESPLSNVTTGGDLDHLANEAKRLVRSIDRFRRGALRPDERSAFEADLKRYGIWNQESEEPDAAGLADLEYRAQDMLQEHIPARRRWLTDQAAIQPTVKQLFPELLDKTSPDYARSQEIVKAIPVLRSFPNWQILVGTFIAGQRALEEKFKAKPKATKAAAAAPKVAAAPVAAAAARPVNGDGISQEVRDRARAGDKEAMVSLVESRLLKTKS